MRAPTIEWPTAEEEDWSRRFQVNRNYLLSLSQHLQNAYGWGIEEAGKGLLVDLRRQVGFSRIQHCAPRSSSEWRSALSLSWTGLVQLELASWSQVNFNLPYTNAWAPVHAYYAVSGAARAWLMAQGQSTTSHAGLLKAIGSEVQSRRLYPSPWNVACNGCCHVGTHCFDSCPPGFAPADPGVLLQSPDTATFWPRYLKMLETTRKNVLDQRYKEWKRQRGRKRMVAADKESVARTVPPTTLFDFLWRLRVRSNYHGVEPFLMSGVSDSWHRDFHESIRLIAHLTSLMLDCWLSKRVGREEYGSAVDGFMKYRDSSPEPVAFLVSRKRLLGPREPQGISS